MIGTSVTGEVGVKVISGLIHMCTFYGLKLSSLYW